MPIRVDLATRTVTLSPGALLAPTARRIGDGRGGSVAISVRYFSAHSSAQPNATAQGMYLV